MTRRSSRRWAILVIGVFAQAAASAVVYGIPFLVPTLRDERGLSLAAVGLLVAAPTTGLLLALIAWGAVVDRVGERVPMAMGLAVCGLVVGALALVHPTDLLLVGGVLLVGGMGAASVNAASGRLIMGWFDVSERGLAMGIRQTALPLGVAAAALTLPVLAQREGAFPALVWPSAACVLAAALVLVVAVDAPRPPREPGEAPPASPYRTATLWRVHAASALLVVPQFAIASFALEYLVRERSWAAGVAGAFLAAAQVAGAVGRIATGWWSDRVASRLRPMRQLGVASAGVLLIFALGDAVAPWVAVAAIAVGSVITVADNGLAFVATAELAGPFWSGRALGVQNTTQNLVASGAVPVLGALIGLAGYPVAFAVAAAAPLLATGVTPVRREHETPDAVVTPVMADPGERDDVAPGDDAR